MENIDVRTNEDIYGKIFKTNYGKEFMLLGPQSVDNYVGLDKVNAKCQVMNVGCVIVYPDTLEPFGNEYDLDEIYMMIENGECR